MDWSWQTRDMGEDLKDKITSDIMALLEDSYISYLVQYVWGAENRRVFSWDDWKEFKFGWGGEIETRNIVKNTTGIDSNIPDEIRQNPSHVHNFFKKSDYGLTFIEAYYMKRPKILQKHQDSGLGFLRNLPFLPPNVKEKWLENPSVEGISYDRNDLRLRGLEQGYREVYDQIVVKKRFDKVENTTNKLRVQIDKLLLMFTELRKKIDALEVVVSNIPKASNFKKEPDMKQKKKKLTKLKWEINKLKVSALNKMNSIVNNKSTSHEFNFDEVDKKVLNELKQQYMKDLNRLESLKKELKKIMGEDQRKKGGKKTHRKIAGNRRHNKNTRKRRGIV